MSENNRQDSQLHVASFKFLGLLYNPFSDQQEIRHGRVNLWHVYALPRQVFKCVGIHRVNSAVTNVKPDRFWNIWSCRAHTLNW